jgi:hypothetical protein
MVSKESVWVRTQVATSLNCWRVAVLGRLRGFNIPNGHCNPLPQFIAGFLDLDSNRFF